MSDSLFRRTPMPMPVRLGAAVGMVLLAAACSSGSSSSSSSSSVASSATGTPAAASSATSSGTGAATATVISTASSSGGKFLTNGSGRAVYMWVKDGKDKSECSGSCATAWPPVTTTGSVTASGSAVSADLGTITRAGGAKQVTYDGHPLYYYTGDTGSGQVNGQGSTGFGAYWWILAPSGSPITSSVTVSGASTSTSSGNGNGGY
jgi:predicted lipoprotein with Yx(FWY)xxD motif